MGMARIKTKEYLQLTLKLPVDILIHALEQPLRKVQRYLTELKNEVDRYEENVALLKEQYVEDCTRLVEIEGQKIAYTNRWIDDCERNDELFGAVDANVRELQESLESPYEECVSEVQRLSQEHKARRDHIATKFDKLYSPCLNRVGYHTA
jgi:chromosome segregation ATPase